MVVCYLNLVGVPIFPSKTHPVLSVDPDRVLPGSISHKRFEPVAGNLAQCLKTGRGIQSLELRERPLLYLSRDLRTLTIEQPFRFLIRPTLYHVGHTLTLTVSSITLKALFEFQFSPDPKAERNGFLLVSRRTRAMFQSSPNPKVGRNGGDHTPLPGRILDIECANVSLQGCWEAGS